MTGKKEEIIRAKTKDQILKRLDKNKTSLSNKNYQLLREFVESMFNNEICSRRIYRYIDVLLRLNQIVEKDFDKVGRPEIDKFATWLREKNDYKEQTKVTYKKMAKRFFRWMNDEETPKFLKHLKATCNKKTKLPSDILTPDEVEKLIESIKKPRDKAMVSLLYEAGLRVGELWTLKIKSIEFDKNGAVVIVDGKTGMRRVRVVRCVPYLSIWIKLHPKNSHNSDLWVNDNGGKRISYNRIREILTEARKKAGIKKHIHPHLLRHSRATHLAKHLKEVQMCEYFGWVIGSDMPRTYIHLSGRDMDDSILQIYGIKKQKVETENRAPVKCPRCSAFNGPESKSCSNCGLTFDLAGQLEKDKEAKRYDDILCKLLEDKEIKELIKQKLKAMN